MNNIVYCFMRAPDLTKEKVETTTYSIKREDSTNKLLSLKSECSTGDFTGVIKVCCYSFNIDKGTEPNHQRR